MAQMQKHAQNTAREMMLKMHAEKCRKKHAQNAEMSRCKTLQNAEESCSKCREVNLAIN